MIVVREALAGDVEAMRAVHAASICGLAASHYDAEQIESWSDVEDVDYPVGETGVYSIVAEADDRETERDIVGFGDVHVEDGEVGAVYVHPDHAGEGVGSAILRELEEWATDAGLTDLHLTASLNAVPFYERNGWKSAGETIHELQDGVELEARAMEKSL